MTIREDIVSQVVRHTPGKALDLENDDICDQPFMILEIYQDNIIDLHSDQ